MARTIGARTLDRAFMVIAACELPLSEIELRGSVTHVSASIAVRFSGNSNAVSIVVGVSGAAGGLGD